MGQWTNKPGPTQTSGHKENKSPQWPGKRASCGSSNKSQASGFRNDDAITLNHSLLIQFIVCERNRSQQRRYLTHPMSVSASKSKIHNNQKSVYSLINKIRMKCIVTGLRTDAWFNMQMPTQTSYVHVSNLSWVSVGSSALTGRRSFLLPKTYLFLTLAILVMLFLLQQLP